MKFNTHDPIIAEIRKIRENASQKIQRDPDKFWAEMEEIRKGAKKYDAKKAILMRNKKSASEKKK